MFFSSIPITLVVETELKLEGLLEILNYYTMCSVCSSNPGLGSSKSTPRLGGSNPALQRSSVHSGLSDGEVPSTHPSRSEVPSSHHTLDMDDLQLMTHQTLPSPDADDMHHLTNHNTVSAAASPVVHEY